MPEFHLDAAEVFAPACRHGPGRLFVTEELPWNPGSARSRLSEACRTGLAQDFDRAEWCCPARNVERVQRKFMAPPLRGRLVGQHDDGQPAKPDRGRAGGGERLYCLEGPPRRGSRAEISARKS